MADGAATASPDRGNGGRLSRTVDVHLSDVYAQPARDDLDIDLVAPERRQRRCSCPTPAASDDTIGVTTFDDEASALPTRRAARPAVTSRSHYGAWRDSLPAPAPAATAT